MKSLAIICPKPPWFNEGQARVVREHSIRMAKKFNLEIFCCDPSGKDIGIHNWNGIKVNVYKGFTNAYLFSWKLFKDLRKREFDIVHSHGFTTFLPLVSCYVKTKRLVFQPHFHPVGSTLSFKIFRKIYDPIIGRYLVNKYNKILCVSEYEKTKLKKKYNLSEKKLSVVYDGIDYESFSGLEPFKTKDKVILYVGRLEKYKNIHRIIQSMKFIKGHKLVIIGRGPYKKNLDNLITKLNLNNKIKILNNVGDKEVSRWYKTCKLFITLSDIESFGLTVIEALAAKKPVIVNYETSLSELADKFNEVIPVKLKDTSTESLSTIIKETISKNINVDLNLKEFNWDNIVNKIIKIYDERK